jgi:hypothetical protein
MLEPLFGEIRDRLPTWCVNSRCQEIPLVTAHYGADAGIAGAAALCRELFPHNLESKTGATERI